jgi:filamentous hemagglutinin family protein
MWRAKFPPILLYSISLVSFYSSTALAQTIPDNTLGSESSTVNQDETIGDTLVDLIEGGATRGNNLFHSFSEFNVGDGSSVYFANPDGIANILTRVTGNNPSEIFGTLGVNGAANLFLLNPNGVVFGENAALDLNGSFLATTADNYVFENDFVYSASNPNLPPLLTINLPVGIQFGNQAEAIEVKGTGHNLALDPSIFIPIRDQRPVGLKVNSVNTLALMGGEINITGGNLTAAAGRIELGGVAEKSNLSLIPTDDGFSFGYQDTTSFKNINLTQAASIDLSGNGSGNLQIQGKNISLLDTSTIINNTIGTENGGDVKITASDSVEIIGTDQGFFPSAIFSQTLPGTTGNSGNVSIEAEKLQISKDALILNSTIGEGNGGDIDLKVAQLNITESLNQFYATGLFTDTYGNGRGGNLTIATDNLQIENGGQIITSTFGAGDSGNLSVTSKKMEIIGVSSINGSPSGLFASTYGAGKGGNLTIATDNLQIKDGAEVATGTFGAGDSGNLSVTSKKMEIIGVSSVDGSPSGLFTSTFATGKGGNLTIATDNLQIKDGGQIGTGTFSAGDSGDLSIQANNIEISGTSPVNGFSSGIFTPVSTPKTTGDGGNLTIDAERLVVREGGLITSFTAGEGNAGNININVQELKIDGGAAQITTLTYGKGNAGNLNVSAADFIEISGTKLVPISENQFFLLSNGLLATVEFGATGNGGNLTVETPNLKISDGGQILTSTSGAGHGGNLLIRADNLEVKDTVVNNFNVRSGISSSVEEPGANNGGDIEIIADNLSLLDGGLVAANALGQGNAGNIKIDAQNIDITGVSSGEPVFGIEQQKLSSQISAFSEGDFNAGSININTNSLNVSDRGNVSVSNSGNGNSGELNIIAKELNLDNYAILEAKVNAGSQGNIRLTTDNIFLNNYSLVTAKAKGKATGGNITINNTDNIVLLENSQIIADAEEGNGGNIEITTQGYFVSGDSLVSASSEFGLDGNINVENINGDRPLELDQLPANLVDRTQQIAKSCGVGTNQFAIAGRGGLPENPWQNLRGQSVWQDLRLTEIDSNNTNQVQAEQPSTLALEAQAWKINNQGQIELIAIGADARRLDNQAGCQ